MDVQALTVGLAALITAVGGTVAGIYTGKATAHREQGGAAAALEQARLQRDQAEEEASRGRIDALVEDLVAARKRAREMEDDFDRRYGAMRQHAQRGWDLASFHFANASLLAHLLNNIFTIVTLEGSTDAVINVVRNAMIRMKNVNLPIGLEDPIPPRIEKP